MRLLRWATERPGRCLLCLSATLFIAALSIWILGAVLFPYDSHTWVAFQSFLGEVSLWCVFWSFLLVPIGLIADWFAKT